MGQCQRPGCTGQIDEDGYCSDCGYKQSLTAPPAPAQAPVAQTPVAQAPVAQAPVAQAPPGAGADGQPCQRPGCTGVYLDGYCNVNGHPAPAADGPSTGSVAGNEGPPTVDPPASTTSTAGDTSTLRAGGGGASTGRTSISSGSRGGGDLGAGMVDMPSVQPRDPQSAVLVDPEVPERRRFCARCESRVGRTHEGRPARTEGYCPQCGKPYSFTPKLREGDLVAGQYRVAGCIAHGGLGWIYLAQNLNLTDRWGGFVWVVLKGLLDSEDEAAAAVAVAERQFLAEVRHRNIVQIYNAVQHEGAGYIVMEYVGGESLREVLKRTREETGEALPVQQAIAYMLAVLPAFGYLHARGLLYCDFKPDNAIHTDDQLTLIDLGAVRAIDAGNTGDTYGTTGYQAPEVPDEGVSVESDLYTVGRTLAALSLTIAGFQDKKRYAVSLPPASDVELFRRYEAFYQFLVKATKPDRRSRFRSAAEMAEQLVGVLRQVRAIDGEPPQPAPSLLFSAELGNAAEASTWRCLPVPAVDPFDPAAGVLATIVISGPEQIQAMLQATPRSPEVAFRLARSFIDAGDFAAAEAELNSPAARAQPDAPEAPGIAWRAAWWRGVLRLAAGLPTDAQPYFAAVISELPGELAPRLALAVACELAALGDHGAPGSTNGGPVALGYPDDLDRAAHHYEIVAATDPGFASACFGLSRVRIALGDRAGAVAALQRVPASSSSHAAAQVALCGVLCAHIAGHPPDLADLAAASGLLDHLRAEPAVRLALGRDLQVEALSLLAGDVVTPDPDVVLAGAPFTDEDLRGALEATYRSLARLAHSDQERFELVDLANAYRPRTLT